MARNYNALAPTETVRSEGASPSDPLRLRSRSRRRS